MVTEKRQYALETVLAALPEDCRERYREVAEYAISLGYMPALKGARKDYADFTKSKTRRTILKINADPRFRLISIKFFALPSYSGVFEEALAARLAYWEQLGYEAHCFGCGKCDGTQGYPIPLPGGGEGFLCGFGLIPLPTFRAGHVPEVKEALRIQDEFFGKM